MAYTIVRNYNKTGLVLLESSIEVAADGFVQIPAKFLAPSTGVRSDDFVLDSLWPLSSLPVGLPPIQGGPYLSNRTIKRQNGVTYIDALYVSALNPVRISISETDGKASFSGYAPPVQVGLIYTEAAALLSYDYTAVSVTHSYSIVGDNAFNPPLPVGRIGERYNVVSINNTSRVAQDKKDIITRNVEKVGRVQRISVTANPYIQVPYNQLVLSAASQYINA